jgi:hemolysin type calcium-binding protein
MLVGLRRRSGAVAMIAFGGLLGALLFAAPGRGSTAITCEYVEAGVPGPLGNVLRIDDRSQSVTHIFNRGGAIVVFNNEDSDEATCTGGLPTVLTVDRIEYTSATGVPFVNYLGSGPLAPGATPEASGSEIEVSIHEDYRPQVLNVGGSPASETAVAGQLGPRKLGVNLNAQDDGAAQDADVVLAPVDPTQAVVRVVGRGGADTLTALGGPGFTGSLIVDRLLLAGADGDDTLVGGPHDDGLNGGDGNDTLLGGAGRDRLTVGPGADLAKAGTGRDRIENRSDVGGIPPDTGPDRVFAGDGDDQVDVEQLLRGDRVKCGSGRHDSAIVDRGDRARGCERVETFRP